MGAGEGSGCRRGGARRRRAGAGRRARQRRHRRPRAHRHHHRRTGAGHHTHHGHRGIHLFFGGIGAGRRQGHRAGVSSSSHTSTTVHSSSSRSGGGSGRSSVPKWVAPVVVSLALLSMTVVAFAVPAVPFSLGITSLIFFVLIIVVPLVRNVVQTQQAQAMRAQANDDVEAGVTAAGSGAGGARSWAEADQPGAEDLVWRELFGGANINQPASSATIIEIQDETTPGYAYDPPPSFAEATAANPASYPGGVPMPQPSAPPQAPPPPPIYGQAGAGGMPYPPPAEAGTSGRDTPPPPSYEDAVGMN